MKIPEERPFFHRQSSRNNPYRMLLWATLIVMALVFLRGYDQGDIGPFFMPTPTPTRTVDSYLLEAQAAFEAGDLDATIAAYQGASSIDPNNALVLAELARVQTYSSELFRTDKFARLEEAQADITRAVELDPNSSYVHAIFALVLDWKASAHAEIGEFEIAQTLLADAEEAAVRAVQLDPGNVLAQAFQAEVLIDRGDWVQARQLAESAAAREPNLMDTRRIYAQVLENTGFYSDAVGEYQAAAAINPNFTYFYIKIGQMYRQLGQTYSELGQGYRQQEMYDYALEAFDTAATINETLGIKNPLPYIGIAKTYVQLGQFFIAARNVQRAIAFDPADANSYGVLGDIWVRSRNFEDSIPNLRCATIGCTAEQNIEQDVDVVGLGLNDSSLPYYLRFISSLASLNQCEEAYPVMDQLDAAYPDNELVTPIVQENRNICIILQEEDQ